MGRGVRMRAARRGPGGPRVSIRELEKGRAKDLTCLFCDASVKFTPAHRKKASKRPVAAYLSLFPRHEHRDACEFNVNTYLKTLVAASSKLEIMAPSLIEGPDGYLFRLNYLAQAHAELRTVSGCADYAEAAHPRVGTDFVPTAQRLEPYFSSATGVARLRALALSAKELEDAITIWYLDHMIKWKDFYFDEDRYLTLYKTLRSNVRTLHHPVALSVTPKQHSESNGPSGRRYIVQCYAQVTPIPGDDRPEIVVPRLYWSEGVKAGRLGDEEMDHDFIVLGYPNASPSRARRGESVRFRNLNLSIFGAHQLSRIYDCPA